MRTLSIKIVIVILALGITSIFSQGITFSLANGEVTNEGSIDYYEFDVLMEASENTQFYIAQVYVDYNIDAFGSNVVSNSKLTFTEGPILTDVIDGTPPNLGVGNYELALNDNTPSKIAIQNTHLISIIGSYTGAGFELSNTLGVDPIVYAHLKMEIANNSFTSQMCQDNTINQFELQQRYYTTPGTNETAIYAPVSLGVQCLDDPLPVELVSFTAVYQNSEIVLNWKTETEVNNYGFNIERRINKGDWDSIAFIEGSGNSNSPKNYSYCDQDLFAGGSNFQYRLKQVDNDGTFEYSYVVEVDIIPTQYELSQNYPNPFNPSTTIRFSLPKATQLKINLYNMLGEKIETIVEGLYEAGFYKVLYNAHNLPSGAYIYRIESSEFVQVKKLMLLK
jgi:hypothetical protein